MGSEVGVIVRSVQRNQRKCKYNNALHTRPMLLFLQEFSVPKNPSLEPHARSNTSQKPQGEEAGESASTPSTHQFNSLD